MVEERICSWCLIFTICEFYLDFKVIGREYFCSKEHLDNYERQLIQKRNGLKL